MELTKQQKIELGIEILSAVESCKNDFSMKAGAFIILKETELSKMPKSIQKEFTTFSPQLQHMFKSYCNSMKVKLTNDAMYVSARVLQKLDNFGNLLSKIGNGLNKCLHGYEFGVDYDELEDICDHCEKAKACYMAFKDGKKKSKKNE